MMFSKERARINDASSPAHRASQRKERSTEPKEQLPRLAGAVQKAGLSPRSLAPLDVLRLQRTIGNRAVDRLSTQREQHPSPRNESNNTGLPVHLKAVIENLSGCSMDDVRVHYNSDSPARLQAHAYTQGNDIYLASGQEEHLPHEAWHAVQQKQGRVETSLQREDGTSLNDDAGLEEEADTMGGKAVEAYRAEEHPTLFPVRNIGLREGTASVARAATSFVIQRNSINLNGAALIKPGPPPTLKSGNYYYKVFDAKEQADAMLEKWDAADTAGVITPEHKVVKVTRNNAQKWAFRSKEAAGRFFQFSKQGHTNIVREWIAIQTNRAYLQRLRNIFNYVHAHIGDGQGFFENSDGGNILFIDINTNGNTPNAADVVNSIDDRLKVL